jgi:HK97 family phage major capsid protein
MNKGKKFSVREYIERREEIKLRMNEIADLAEKEDKREFTEAEKAELKHLEREMNVFDVKIASAGKTGYVEVSARELEFDEYLREAMKNQGKQNNVLQREAMLTTDVDAMIPLSVNDVVKPLEEGLILGQLGLPVMTGLNGDFVWPVAGSIEAEIAGETVELSDKKIDFAKVKPNPQRVGVSVTVSAQTIWKTNGVAYEVVKQQLPQAMARALNKAVLGTAEVSHSLVGPFAALAKKTGVALTALKTKEQKKAAQLINFAGELPTYKELVAMKGLCLLKGVEGNYMAYVMDEYTKAMLECTPIDEGSGRMVIENGMIAGVPVKCTNYINSGSNTYVGFGCFGYLPLQGFGDMRFVIDPYTKAKNDSVVLTLNEDWAATVLREEAFILGKCAAGA